MSSRKVATIKRAIEYHINPVNNKSLILKVYGNWHIGITNDVTVRKAQHKRDKNTLALYFKSWNAVSKKAAREIEDYFHKIGMKDKHGAGGAKMDSCYVYIFKINTNIVDGLVYLFG